MAKAKGMTVVGYPFSYLHSNSASNCRRFSLAGDVYVGLRFSLIQRSLVPCFGWIFQYSPIGIVHAEGHCPGISVSNTVHMIAPTVFDTSKILCLSSIFKSFSSWGNIAKSFLLFSFMVFLY